MNKYKLANSLLKAGQLREAEEVYKQSIASGEEVAACLHDLGIIKCRNNKIVEGIRSIAEAISIESNQIGYWKNLFQISDATRNYTEIIALLTRLRLQTSTKTFLLLNQVEDWLENKVNHTFDKQFTLEFLNLPNEQRAKRLKNICSTYDFCSMKLGYEEEFEYAYTIFLRSSMDWKIAHYLAVTAQKMLRHDLSNRYGSIATRLKPEQASLWYNLSNYQRANGVLDEAIKSLEKCVELRPSETDYKFALANTFVMNEDFLTAEKIYRGIYLAHQGNKDFHQNLGVTLLELGKYTECVNQYKRAEALSPDDLAIQENLAIAHTEFGMVNEAIDALKKKKAKKPLHFSVYRQLQSLGETIEADVDMLSDQFQQKDTQETDQIQIGYALGNYYESKEQYETAYFYYAKANEISQCLLSYDPESTYLLFEKLKKISAEDPSIKLLDHKSTKDFQPILIVGMPRSGTTLLHQIIALNCEHVSALGELNALKNAILSSDILSENLSIDQLRYVRDFYRKKICERGCGSPVFLDKMPLNFMWSDIVLRVFPNCKILNIQRNKKAVVWSIFKNYFATNGNQFNTKIDDIIHYYGLYNGLMSHYSQLYPKNIMNIKYEDLISSQRDVFSKLSDFIGFAITYEKDLSQYKGRIATLSKQTARDRLVVNRNENYLHFEHFLQSDFPTFKSII